MELEDCTQLRFKLSEPTRQSFVTAMVDTGSQSCLAGLQVVEKLGISTKDLIPVDLRMYAADIHNIHILGAFIMQCSGKSSKGEEKSTRQMVYVTDCSNKLFLSWEGCVDWGIIPHTFPTMDEIKKPDNPIIAATTMGDTKCSATTMGKT